MATGTITLYNNAKLKLVDGSFDLDTHTFKIILLNNSHAFNAAHTQLSDVTANQLATANGYTQNSMTLGSVTLGQTGGVVTFDAADVVWTASGSGITASYAVVYNDTVANDLLLFNMTFSGPESAGSGTNFNIIWDATGIFQIA